MGSIEKGVAHTVGQAVWCEPYAQVSLGQLVIATAEHHLAVDLQAQATPSMQLQRVTVTVADIAEGAVQLVHLRLQAGEGVWGLLARQGGRGGLDYIVAVDIAEVVQRQAQVLLLVPGLLGACIGRGIQRGRVDIRPEIRQR